MNLGQTIKQARQKKGFSQGDLARLANITTSYLSLLENNQKEPSMELLRNLGDKLNLPVPVLFFMAMDENDVPVGKREAYKFIQPTIQAMVSEFFIPQN